MNRRNFLAYSAAAGITTAFSKTFSFASKSLNLPDSGADDSGELSYHTLESIRFTPVKLIYPRLVGKNSHKGIHGLGPTATVCTLTTKQGASGIGMLRSSQKKAEEIFSQLKGKKITDVFALETGVSDQAQTFDIPLHDLAGIILNKPVYKLLGGDRAIPTKYYSGMIYMDDVDIKDKQAGFEKILEECQYDYNRGYRQLKLKIGRGFKWMSPEEGLKRDVEITRLVHRNFPDIEILVDGNDGFTPKDFIRYLEQLEDVPIFWIEEPFRENITDNAMLRKWLNENMKRSTLLADGETDPELKLILEMGKKQILDVFIGDIMGYGFTNWRKVMPALKENGLLGSPHNWGEYMKSIYSAHIAWGLGNVVTLEGVTASSNDIDFGYYRLDKGILLPSDAPGFGMTLLKQ